MAIVELVFFAVTSTPSIGPSSAEVTCPVKAACDGARLPVWPKPGRVRKATLPAIIRMTKKNRVRIDTSMPFDEPENGHVTEHLWSRTLSVISTVASAGRDSGLEKSVSLFRPEKHGAHSLY